MEIREFKEKVLEQIKNYVPGHLRGCTPAVTPGLYPVLLLKGAEGNPSVELGKYYNLFRYTGDLQYALEHLAKYFARKYPAPAAA